MKHIIFTFVLLYLLIIPNIVLAENTIDCTLTIDYQETSLRVSHKSHSSTVAAAEAIRSGCRNICHDDDNSICSQNCIKNAELSAIECFSQSDELIEQNKEKARQYLINSYNSKNKKESASSNDSNILLPANAYHSTSGLLWSKWMGNKPKTQKDKSKKSKSLLLDPKHPPKNLMINRIPPKNAPLLFK